jgi:hypothetical protein
MPRQLPGRPTRFSVDGWDPGYGAAVQTGEDLTPSEAMLDVNVEMPKDAWRSVPPGRARPAPTVWFVDGVRRLEAQLWIHGDDGSEPSAALACSYAAGVVRSAGGSAEVMAVETRRGLFTTAPHAADIDSSVGVWSAYRSPADPRRPANQVLVQAVQRQLTELERQCARTAQGRGAGDDLLVVDGPIRERSGLEHLVGHIKTHEVRYLPPDLNRHVGRLLPGERTPVFLLGTTWDRFTWYLRLPGGQEGAPWSGVVRIESPADTPAAQAIALADITQATLPRFASHRFKDPRAPQNLYPIGGLERELRHRLGDPLRLRRSLQAAASRS